MQRSRQRAAIKYAQADLCRGLNEGAGAFLWPTPAGWTISRRAEDVQSLDAVHLSALTLNAPFNSFLPAHDPVLSPSSPLFLFIYLKS